MTPPTPPDSEQPVKLAQIGNTVRERWRHFLKHRVDDEGFVRSDLLRDGARHLRQMPTVSGEQVPTEDELLVFAGATWLPIGPEPLRVDASHDTMGSGPAAGTVVDILIDPAGTSDSIIYIATNNGGIWKSTNGGGSWEPKTDLMPGLAMGALAMDPNDHDVIYAGTGNTLDGGHQELRSHGIYRSIDAGETWSVIGADVLAGHQVLRIVMPSAGVLVVATNIGVFRSVDGGASFGANAPSFDDGASVLPGVITDLLIEEANPDTIYACARGVGIFRSTDAGATFPTNLFLDQGQIPQVLSAPAQGAPTLPFDWISIAQSVQPDNQVIYALVTEDRPKKETDFKGLFRSSDRGTTWTVLPAAAGPAAQNGGLQNGYDVTIAVDPLDPKRVYMGFQELYRSTDSGGTFGSVAISRNSVHWDHHVTKFTPHRPVSAPTPFYVGTDGGISRNDDGNKAWKNLNETIACNLLLGLDIGRRSDDNRRFSFAGAQDTGTSQHTPDSVANDWHLGFNGDGTRVVVDPADPQRVYSRSQPLLIISSTAGTTWSQVNAAVSGLPESEDFKPSAKAKPMAVDPNNSDIVYVASGDKLFRSTDKAKKFKLMHTFTSSTVAAEFLGIGALAMTAQDSNVIVVGLSDGTVHRTINADATSSTWTKLTVTGQPTRIVTGAAIDPDNAATVVVTYSGFSETDPANLTGHVFFSADVSSSPLVDIGGTAGGDPTQNVPDLPVHDVVIDTSSTPHPIIIGCDVDVLRTTDGGATWHIFGAGLPNADCTALAIDNSATPPMLRVGTYGRSAFELIRPNGARIRARSNLAFGEVAVGAQADLTCEIFNVGDAPLEIQKITFGVGGSSYSLVGAPDLPFAITAADSLTLTVRFAPTTSGKHITTLDVESSDDIASSIALPVSGTTLLIGPRVTSIQPTSGSPKGVTPVKIFGSGLSGATSVLFGTANAPVISEVSDQELDAMSPGGSGVVMVRVVTPLGTTPPSPGGIFIYESSGPVVTSVTPSQGPATGGTTVTIVGSGFGGATEVLFGQTVATSRVFNSDTEITAVSPAGNGTVDVFVATTNTTSPASDTTKFQYTTAGAGTAVGGAGAGFGAAVGGSGTPSADNLVLAALADLLRTGSDPAVLEAQRILLRRVALEGNVVDSRVPPPKNITEIGGYINLLTALAHSDIRTQMLASTLGVAGPATSLSIGGEGPVLAFVSLINDRPEGAAQPSLTPTFTIRTDMADGLAEALQKIHGLGAGLPLHTPPRTLPVATPGTPKHVDLLEILGRTLRVAPAALLRDPATDPIAIARKDGDPADAWLLVARELDDGALVPPATWIALQGEGTTVTTGAPEQRQYVPLAPLLAAAGWYSEQPLVAPTSATEQGSLPRLVNLMGLLVGETLLDDELSLLYSRSAIAASRLAGMSSWVWNGVTFVSPTAAKAG